MVSGEKEYAKENHINRNAQVNYSRRKGAQWHSGILNQENLQVHGSLLKFKHKPTSPVI